MELGVNDLEKLAPNYRNDYDIQLQLLELMVNPSNLPFLRNLAAKLLGTYEGLNLDPVALGQLMDTHDANLVSVAVIELAKTNHQCPPQIVTEKLQDKGEWPTLLEEVNGCHDLVTAQFMLDDAVKSQNYDFLYGLNYKPAATIAAENLTKLSKALPGNLPPNNVQVMKLFNYLMRMKIYVEGSANIDVLTSLEFVLGNSYYSVLAAEASKILALQMDLPAFMSDPSISSLTFEALDALRSRSNSVSRDLGITPSDRTRFQVQFVQDMNTLQQIVVAAQAESK